MDRKRQLALVFATIGVALGAGHIVQSSAGGAQQAAAAEAPTTTGTGTAAPESAAPTTLANAVPAPPTDILLAELSPSLAEARPGQSAPVSDMVIGTGAPLVAVTAGAAPDPALIGPTPSQQPTEPATTQADAATQNGTTPVTTLPPATIVAADACAVTMKLVAAPQAMIGISLKAPCAPDTRVVLGHSGLVITGRTDSYGALFLSIPALAADATVTARVPGTTEMRQDVLVPTMARLRRVGVQWQGADAFQLHAFENGAGYGDVGHISAASPQTPLTGLPSAGGYITLLGDAKVALPLMAEIYTFPAGAATDPDVAIEAAVTAQTCGRELMGETIMTLAGAAYVTELTLAMPDCDGVGDILLLKNLLPDLTLAAAE